MIERAHGNKHVHGEDRPYESRGSHLPAQEINPRRNQTYGHLDLDFQPPVLGGKKTYILPLLI